MKKFTLLYFLMYSLMFANMGVFPGIIETTLEDGSSREEFLVFNQSSEKKLYSVKVGDLTAQGEESEIAKKMRVFPLKFSLEPGKSQKVRLAVREFKGVDNGEYRATIEVAEKESKLEEKYKSSEKKIDGGVNLKVNIVTVMSVYAHVGEKIGSLKIDVERGKNRAVIHNIGNYSTLLKYKVLREGKKIKEEYLPKAIEGQSVELIMGDIRVTDEIEIYSMVLSNSKYSVSEVREDKLLFKGSL